jgi:hypothetical protein
MDTSRLASGQRLIQTMPLELVISSDDESDVEDAPPRVNGVNGVDHEDVEGSDEESEEDWDLDSLIEDAIEELSDDQLLAGKYFDTSQTVRR